MARQVLPFKRPFRKDYNQSVHPKKIGLPHRMIPVLPVRNRSSVVGFPLFRKSNTRIRNLRVSSLLQEYKR